MEGVTCERCGGLLQKPIYASVTSSGRLQRYLACPYCLTEVKEKTGMNNQQASETTVKLPPEKSVTKAHEERCPHHPGYLRERPKNTPVPEECLVCDRMIECLLQ